MPFQICGNSTNYECGESATKPNRAQFAHDLYNVCSIGAQPAAGVPAGSDAASNGCRREGYDSG